MAVSTKIYIWLVGRKESDKMDSSLDRGLVLSTKIIRSEKFSERVIKFKTQHFCQKGQKKYLADVLAWLTY
jgi:hypothetical protein